MPASTATLTTFHPAAAMTVFAFETGRGSPTSV